MRVTVVHIGPMLLALSLVACSREARQVDPGQPQTAPAGPDDPRKSRFADNLFQVAQGGRYFTWYGCAACHHPRATGALDLADRAWRHGGTVDAVYRSIAERHGQYAYGRHIPAEQLWQLSVYVRQLPTLDPARRRRQDTDQRGEPQAQSWGGALR